MVSVSLECCGAEVTVFYKSQGLIRIVTRRKSRGRKKGLAWLAKMETCRTCAKCDFEDETNWLDLFHPIPSWTREMIQIRAEFGHWKLEISQNDGLPQKICSDCFSKFCNVYTFRQSCQAAQVKLNNIFDKIETQSMEDETMDNALERAKRRLEDVEYQSNKNDANATKFKRLDMLEYDDEGIDRGGIPEEVEDNNGAALRYAQLLEHTLNQKESITDYSKVDAADETETQNFVNPLDQRIVEKEVEDATVGHNTQILDNPLEDQTEQVSETTITTYITAVNIEVVGDDNEETALTNTVQYDEDHGEGEEEDLVQFVGDEEEDYDVFQDEIDEEEAEFEFFEPITNANFIALDNAMEEEEQEFDINYNNDGKLISLTFECRYCYKSKDMPSRNYNTQEALLEHITAKHNSEHPFDCPQCELGFRDAASRTMHLKDAHVEKGYTCDVCGKKYADRFNLRHHVEKYHSERDFECELCEKRFYSRKSLNYHKKWHNPERQLKCSYCDRLFINQRHLKCHEATHTGVRNSEYCSFCGKSFIHLKTLRWHIYRQHGGEKPFKCGNCTEVFASYSEKRLHMLENHLENLTSMEKTECMLCHKRYENETDLKEHMAEDHQPRQSASLIIKDNKRVVKNKRQKQYSGIFQCTQCDQRFNMKSALERHVAVHSTEGRPHACPECPKRFKRIQDMNWHRKTHSNEKPNICDVCGKGFALKYVLTQHKRSHEVLEKNHKCLTCGKAYLFEKSLRVHERVHTGKNYYKCDLCSESFVTHIKFKCHMRKNHTSVANAKELPLDELINIVIP